jgi:phosphoribosylanthranilate isomerase
VSVEIKVCCISDPREVELAIAEGASALGFVGERPPGRGRLDDASIAALISQVAGRRPCWLLSAETTAEALLAQIGRVSPHAVQICDEVAPPVYAALRRARPGLHLVQVVHVDGPQAIDRALAAASCVDALLLDSGVTAGPERRLGGTGLTHDWAISAEIVARAPVPVWLAGGLDADNVPAAIAAVRPAGVDLCSGVRDAAYRLDAARLRAFVRAALVAGGPVQLAEGATIPELQQAVRRLEARMGWLDVDLVETAFLMVEEVGELHAAIRAYRRALARGDDLGATRAAAADELADVLNYLVAIANRLGVDLASASRDKNARNQGRTWD